MTGFEPRTSGMEATALPTEPLNHCPNPLQSYSTNFYQKILVQKNGEKLGKPKSTKVTASKELSRVLSPVMAKCFSVQK